MRNQISIRGMCSAVMLCAVAIVPASQAAVAKGALRSPWDSIPVKMTTAPYTCAPVVHLSADLTTDGFYGDNKGSIIDPVKMKAYAESAGPYKKLGNDIADAADAYRTTGSKAAAQCALRLMDTAAADGVFTGHMSSNQAYFVQGWVIGQIGIAFLKVRDSGLVTQEETAKLGDWMKRVAAQTQNYYDERRKKEENQNNHFYWAGVEVAAIGIAANDRKVFDWGIDTYHNGIKQITPEGTLPLEMRRGQRALHYHLFAASPLVYLAEFGEDNGMDLYAENNYALKRLVERATSGLVDNSFFTKEAGIAQDAPSGNPTAEEIGWAALYVKRFPNPAISALITKAPSLSYNYLGGLPPESR